MNKIEEIKHIILICTRCTKKHKQTTQLCVTCECLNKLESAVQHDLGVVWWA